MACKINLSEQNVFELDVSMHNDRSAGVKCADSDTDLSEHPVYSVYRQVRLAALEQPAQQVATRTELQQK